MKRHENKELEYYGQIPCTKALCSSFSSLYFSLYGGFPFSSLQPTFIKGYETLFFFFFFFSFFLSCKARLPSSISFPCFVFFYMGPTNFFLFPWSSTPLSPSILSFFLLFCLSCICLAWLGLA
jgi:hypothetical protein